MICLSLLKFIFIFIFHFVSGKQRQYFYCPHNCQGANTSKCTIKYISNIENFKSNDATIQLPTPTPQCPIEIVKIEEDKRINQSAFPRTNFTFPKMRGNNELVKFIIIVTNVGGSVKQYEAHLVEEEELWHNKIYVTVDLCNISANQVYNIDVYTSPYKADESPICSNRMQTEGCCERPLKDTYPCSNKNCEEDVFTTHPFTLHSTSTKPEKHQVKTSLENQTKVMFVAGIGLFLLLIVLGATVHCRKIKKPRSKKMVVLVSTGDSEERYADMAHEIATEMKENGDFEHVYFSGWQEQTNNRSVEKLRDVLQRCSVALLLTSPYGKKSYEEFLERKELSTWRDAFVFGSYALYHQFYFSFQQRTKIYIAYIADHEDEMHNHVHKDFSSDKNRFYNLSKPSDLRDLYSDMDELCKSSFNPSSGPTSSRENIILQRN